MKTYTHPLELPRNPGACLTINGIEIETLATGVADFSIVALEPSDFPARVEISAPPSTRIRPLAANIPCSTQDGRISFTLPRPMKLSIDPGDGSKPHYLFANPPETVPPEPGAPGVVALPAGEITEIPLLELEDGQTLYLPGGAVFKGRIHVKGRSGIRICGHGIVDGSYYSQTAVGMMPLIILERCPDARVEDITMVRSAGWMLVLADSTGATVRNVKQIGEAKLTDGIDIVGSSNVVVEDCFLRNNDDCVTVKAFHLGAKNSPNVNIDCRQNVENILVHRCVFANDGGSAMEIGHELSVDLARGITFRDIDVLHVHGMGAVFSLHNYDRSLVRDVLFENIRVEHCYNKLIDFRIARSRYSTDAERGHVSGVTLRDIDWTTTPFNAGYTFSVIGGWDADHAIEDVAIENFRIDGTRVRHLDELEIHTRHCRNLRLENTAQ